MKNYNLKITVLLLLVFSMFSCKSDDNDVVNTAPQISAQTFSVLEDINETGNIGEVKATDIDGDKITYTIQTNSDGLFEITEDGNLYLASGKTLDFETKKSYTITVTVTDGNLNASTQIMINVIDKNETPLIDAQTFIVAENIQTSEEVGTVVAIDPDNDTLSYLITTTVPENTNLFEISNTGVISLSTGSVLDYETQTSYTLTIEVSDENLTSTTDIIIEVTDVNEAPVFVDQPGFSVREDIGDEIIIGTVRIRDQEEETPSFGLSTNPNGLFEISNDGKLSLAPGKNLDYETDTSHSIGVRVTDGTHTVFDTVYVNVIDVIEIIAK